jgi:ABC-2 type transport system permease protein
MNFLELWLRSFKITLHAEMVYRWNFLFKMIGIILVDIFTPIMVIIIYSLTNGIPGWSFYEFILLTAIFITVMGIWHALFSGISWLTTFLVQHGEFDNILVRPYNTLVYLMTRGVDIEGFGEVLAGIIIMLFAISKLSTPIALINVFYMMAVVLLALIFTFSMSVIVASLSIRFVKASSLLDLFYHTSDFGKYPIVIYGASGVFFFTFIVPFGLAAFYPAQALLGKLPFDLFLKLAGVTIVILFLSLKFWNHSLKLYSSAGG